MVKTAFLLRVDDVEGMLACVERLLEDEELRKRIVEKGFEYVNQFSWELSAAKMEKRLGETGSRRGFLGGDGDGDVRVRRSGV